MWNWKKQFYSEVEENGKGLKGEIAVKRDK